MASTLSGNGIIPAQVMWWPRKSRLLLPNWHLGDVYDEAMFLKPLEKKVKILSVGLSVFAGHQDVTIYTKVNYRPRQTVSIRR